MQKIANLLLLIHYVVIVIIRLLQFIHKFDSFIIYQNNNSKNCEIFKVPTKAVNKMIKNFKRKEKK